MSRSGKKKSAVELGHDSFLDIVANLVGILIILVVVLGTQSTAAIQKIQEQVDDEARAATDDQLSQLAQFSMRAASAQSDSNRLEKTVKRYDAMIDFRKQQRDGLMDLLARAQLAWEEKQQDLDKKATEAARRDAEYEQFSEKLGQLKDAQKQLEEAPEEVVAVAHLPTPMAKTVFGDELHFRLKDNRLSIVPVERLINEIRRDFERVASGSRNGLMAAAVGPIRGFVARYEMAKDREMVSQSGRLAMATRIQLVGMTLEPLSEPHGQPIQQVLADRSELDIELAGRDPGATTITVWVYPDSFASFRRLKEHLYAKGFATAGRPLPMDQPISGSPNGTRSRAQ